LQETFSNYLVASDADHLISLIDEISYVSPPSTILSQYDDIPPELFCNSDNRPAKCGENCECVHKVDIPLGAVVEVVLVDEVQQINISHPFHLHGTSFVVLGMGRSPDMQLQRMNLQHALELDKRGLLERRFLKPALKDTVAVPNNGYAVLRFRADNPGVWLFHCHFQFHIVIGMNMLFQVGTPADWPPVPVSFPRCGNHMPPITMW
ncbi:PREDICTED: laccase-21-like, partial [Rhagoletis zephyria]|uniref:laccase-21-like n=1 Tax=Rhagoletis zephyria TaxID=28612 RepID=UPI000811365F